MRSSQLSGDALRARDPGAETLVDLAHFEQAQDLGELSPADHDAAVRLALDKAEMHQRLERLARRQAGNPEIGGNVPLAQARAGRDRMDSDALAQAVSHILHAGAGRCWRLLRQAGGPRPPPRGGRDLMRFSLGRLAPILAP